MSGAAEAMADEKTSTVIKKKKRPTMKVRKGAGEKARDAREGVVTIESIHEDLLSWNVIASLQESKEKEKGSSASSSASAEWGASYESRNSKYSAMGEVEWQAEYDRSYNAAYANASAASNRYSDSEVTVTGIGSDASVIASSPSMINRNEGSSRPTVHKL